MHIRFTDSIPINAPAGAIWQILSQWHDPSGWVPQCRSCEVVDPPGIREGVGAVRRIQEEDQVLVETVVSWEPPSRIVISVSGVPPFVKDVVTTFQVQATANRTAIFSVASSSSTGLGFVGLLFYPLAKHAQRAELCKLLAAMKHYAESGTRATHLDVKRILAEHPNLK
jgi:hypothetical protein